MKVVRSRSKMRRHELLAQLRRPVAASKPSDVLLAMEKWYSALREYIEAGGRAPTFRERRASLLNLLPARFREEGSSSACRKCRTP